MNEELERDLKALIAKISSISNEQDRVDAINRVKQALHEASPFCDEPIDCVLWVKNEAVQANDYNPNSVASSEMRLLEHSIKADGYTQPIVVWRTGEAFEVVDGFHRNRVGRDTEVRQRVRGYLPVTVIKQDRAGRGDRMAATIRHNRARGKHKVEAMSDIVRELHRSGWTDGKISRELGMAPDEVLRLKQITGLAELFADREFSTAWEAVEEPD
jgi:ParB-like chromosome segregation protein Spo0J